MAISIVDIVLTLLAGGIGVGSGYWLRGCAGAAPSPEGEPDEASLEEELRQKEQQRRAQEAMTEVHDVASRVAADVGAHNTRVQEINDELLDGEKTSDAVSVAMHKLLQANKQMQDKLESAEQRLQEQAKKMESYEEQALTDALTSIANRRAFDEFTERQYDEYQRDGRATTVLMLDVDYFKKFNDTYGHAAGDEVLKGVAKVLKRTMRDIDLVARYGGEEFSVVFPGTRVGEAGPATERARAAIESAVFHHQGTDLRVTASFGLAEIRAGETMEQTLRRADEALYASKRAGRNTAHWHDGETSYPVEGTPASRAKEAPVIENSDSSTPAETKAVDSPQPEAPNATSQADLGIDDETRLSNHRSFVEDVRRRFSEWQRTRTPLSLLKVGIDEMPEIENKFGDTGRHVVIKAATQFLKAAMRDMDHVARLDEQSFGLLLPGANLDAAEMISERLRHAIAKCSLPLAGEQLRFTISVGAVEARHGEDGDRMLGRALEAMNAARSAGGNCTFVQNGKAAKASTKQPAAAE